MSSSVAWQLALALVMVLVVYVVASTTRRTVALGALLIAIPFQIVDTQYASASVLMAYALAVILLLNGGLKVRMLPALGLIALGYLVSLSQADHELMTWHVIYVFQFFSCLVVFLLAYNFARLVDSERSVADVLLVMNALVLVYCAIQLTAGEGGSFLPFGIKEFEFNRNRMGSDARLVGPFDNPGSTSGYFALMILFCAVEIVFAKGRRRTAIQVMVVLNLIGLVATGNRAGFLILVATFPVLLLSFRRELGPRRVTQYLVGGVVVLVIASAAAISYTGFGRMFERLQTVTETEDGVPTTRALTWPVAIEKIKEHPWVGEGPFFVNLEAGENLGVSRSRIDPYPHSLYLYLLRTVGIVGLVPIVWFFVQAWRLLYWSLRQAGTGSYSSAILRAGMLLIPAFLVAQITLEFNRLETIDYAQFIFALVGMLVGVADRSLSAAPARMSVEPGSTVDSHQLAANAPISNVR